MSGLRLAVVTRRYWPLVGGEESLLADLAAEFQRQGATVQFVTAQWHADWAIDFVHRELPVTRIRKPAQLGWGTLRYMLELSRWFQTHSREIDLVYVSHLQQDAHAVLGAMRGLRIPVVLRAVGSGETGDCQWQQRVRFGARIRRRCQQADAVVAGTASTLAELHAAEYAAERTFQIPHGIGEFPTRSDEIRTDIRAALGDANLDLVTDLATPVVAYVGRLTRNKGVFDLIRAWKIVAETWPTAKLWLIGDGPDRDELFDKLGEFDLRHSVCLPGSFDDARDLLQAVDLCVVPTLDETPTVTLLEALAAATPVIASDTIGHRALVRHGEHALLTPPGNYRALAGAICQSLDDPETAARRAAAGLRFVRERHALAQIAATHLELFERLVREKKR